MQTLARIIKLVDSDTSDHDASKKLICRVKELLMLAEFPKSLSELGFTHSEIPQSCPECIQAMDSYIQPPADGCINF